MQKRLFFKVLVIGLLTLLLLIPLLMTDNLVQERQYRQLDVTRDIAASYAGSQRIIGPVLVIPWTRTHTETIAATALSPAITRQVQTTGERLVYPAELDTQGQLDTDTKSRGLFSARVFQWKGVISGHFTLPRPPGDADREGAHTVWHQPYLAVAIDDPRGIIGSPTLDWNGGALSFERGSKLVAQPLGIHAALPTWDANTPDTMAFAIQLKLRGTERISFVPLGEANRVELTSSWPHPSFSGRHLPDPESQQINQDGFRAVWTVSALAANAADQLNQLDAHCTAGCGNRLDAMNVDLVEPINVYSLSDRALKYAYLFIVLTFAAFFIFEALKRLAIHPIQYLLVGLALAVFFLLLISLSEHIAFGLAYALSALACCGLITVYLSTVLGTRVRGLGFGGALGALFGALYFLLRSEDNALMLGSLLIFGLLAAAMIATRRVDWYALGPAEKSH
jgi:inner membrane protein